MRLHDSEEQLRLVLQITDDLRCVADTFGLSHEDADSDIATKEMDFCLETWLTTMICLVDVYTLSDTLKRAARTTWRALGVLLSTSEREILLPGLDLKTGDLSELARICQA
jgi:hypothetical protein